MKLLPLLALASAALLAQTQTNYDESKAGAYKLPDPLVLANGRPVRDATTWMKLRRPEVFRLFQTNVYGRSPARPARVRYEQSPVDKQALGGKAVRKQVRVHFTDKPDGPKMDILIYLPAGARRPVPLFAGLNFGGNQSVAADPGVPLREIWVRDPQTRKATKIIAPESSRGRSAGQWQVEKILSRGYGLATIFYGDIEPDYNGGMSYGVRSLYPKPGPEEWGAIGAWAWGLSRAMDYFETDREIDAKRVAVMGHSRLGKTALWAGASDTRFALVISNDSGEGGASLSRRWYGETVQNLNTSFPHWFCANYAKYNDRVSELPVDQHELLALIAPRPVYVASAEEDRWADPKGEFLSAVHAGPVYALFGKQGLGTDQMPGIHQPLMGAIGYHIRAGKHDVTAYDWDQYLNFADMHLRGK
ncbi:MAG: acetylxylan esterase [Bryobacteraceae bacterium]